MKVDGEHPGDYFSVGDRVFVHVPGEGYVGGGEVMQEKTPVTEFQVEYEGIVRNILNEEGPLEAP